MQRGTWECSAPGLVSPGASESDALASKAHPQIGPWEVLVALLIVGAAWGSLSVGQELQPYTACKRMTLSQFPTR